MTNNFSVATFEELIARTGWGGSLPEIDVTHLCDENNLPLADTGRWIFEEVGYKEWRESQESKLLWPVFPTVQGPDRARRTDCQEPGTGRDGRKYAVLVRKI